MFVLVFVLLGVAGLKLLLSLAAIHYGAFLFCFCCDIVLLGVAGLKLLLSLAAIHYGAFLLL